MAAGVNVFAGLSLTMAEAGGKGPSSANSVAIYVANQIIGRDCKK